MQRSKRQETTASAQPSVVFSSTNLQQSSLYLKLFGRLPLWGSCIGSGGLSPIQLLGSSRVLPSRWAKRWANRRPSSLGQIKIGVLRMEPLGITATKKR